MMTPAQIFLLRTMKERGIEKETAIMTVTLLQEEYQIRLMWNWMNSLQNTPSGSQIEKKVMQIINGD